MFLAAKNILIVNQTSGYLVVDIANAYASKYDNIVVMCGTLDVLDIELDENIRVSRIPIYRRSSLFSRIFTWVSSTFVIYFKQIFFYRNYYVLYFTNPPISYFCSLFSKARFSIVIYDLYPDILKSIGINHNNWIFNIWGKINSSIFKRADNIFTLSVGMRDVISKYVSKTKISTIPIWSHNNIFVHIPKSENTFLRNNSLLGKFIVLYSGNLGYTHKVEIIIELANHLKLFPLIQFVIIGDGAKKSLLSNLIAKYGINNCTLLPWQEREVLPHSFGAADIAIVTLSQEVGQMSVPSKTYDYMAAGVPLLCIAPKSSELNSIVMKYRNGSCFEPKEIKSMVNFILYLFNTKNKQISLSHNSLKASLNFTKANAQKFVV